MVKKKVTKNTKTTWKTKVKIKEILREKRPTLKIQKPRDNPYVNRFFDEEWAND